MKRLITTFFFLLFQSSQAFAMSLGEVELHSYLNQPLDATIEINNPTGYTEDQIDIQHASLTEYKKFEIEKNAYVNNILLSVSIENGQTKVHLRSKRLMKELILSFVLTLNWPEGLFSKEYTLLLDPAPGIIAYDHPGIKTDSSATIINNSRPVQLEPSTKSSPAYAVVSTQPLVETAEDTIKAEPLLDGKADTSASVTPAVTSADTSHSHEQNTEHVTSIADYRPDVQFDLSQHKSVNEYTVGYGESITSIAMKLRPSQAYSIQKTSKLLYQLNKHAFLNGNMNALESDKVLQIPDLSSIYLKKHRHLTPEERQQIKSDKVLDNSAVEQAQANNKQTTTETETYSRLRILNPDEAYDMPENVEHVAAGNTSEAPLKTNAEIRQDESRLAESLDEIAHLKEVNDLLREQYKVVQVKLRKATAENNSLLEELSRYETDTSASPDTLFMDPSTTNNVVTMTSAEAPINETLPEHTDTTDPVTANKEVLSDSTAPLIDLPVASTVVNESINSKKEEIKNTEIDDEDDLSWNTIILFSIIIFAAMLYIIFKTSLLYNMKLKYLKLKEKEI